MKKTFLSIMLGACLSTAALADDLSTVYQLALENDPVVNRAKAEKELAYSGIKLSRAALLPTISGSISYSTGARDNVDFTDTGINVITTDNESTRMGLSLNMSLYDHANWIGMDRAEKAAQQGDANLGAALQQLIVRSTNAYLAVLREQDNVEFVKAELRAIERQLEQTKQRFEVGLTAITDVHEAQANFDNTNAQLILAENTLELRLEELREITGQYHADIAELDTDLFSATQPNPAKVDEWLELAKDSNLTLLAQRLSKDIAKEDIDAATAGHYPTLSLNASMDQTDNTFNDFDLPTTDSESIGITLNIPIYEGGRTQTGVERARSNYVIASENLELTYRQTVRSVRSSFNAVKASISRIRALEQSVVSADSALKATEAGFDVGTRTIVDVLNSTRNLFDARRNLADARYGFISAIVNLKASAGTLTEQDLQDINRVLKPAT
ncbi:outer membrane channel protein TolC [Glaciecola sp. KUL10]|uniref:outer membrane channel protein TolC n=1 Tax=Glaciecola sp. (strain KUL10) TaxID=2161813 RepID=UPI000D783D0A|nr:outer membrane channel protein TolC [Glaciecola sp. KUL10]GBL05169.1 outer membrane channel protein [Glaciecola sp. KUL10]